MPHMPALEIYFPPCKKIFKIHKCKEIEIVRRGCHFFHNEDSKKLSLSNKFFLWDDFISYRYNRESLYLKSFITNQCLKLL